MFYSNLVERMVYKGLRWCVKVCKDDVIMYQSEGMVCEGDWMVCEGDGLVCEGDVMV